MTKHEIGETFSSLTPKISEVATTSDPTDTAVGSRATVSTDIAVNAGNSRCEFNSNAEKEKDEVEKDEKEGIVEFDHYKRNYEKF